MRLNILRYYVICFIVSSYLGTFFVLHAMMSQSMRILELVFVLFSQLIRKRTAAIERVKTYLSETIEDHKVTFDAENIRDFIDLYIKASKDESEPELFTGKIAEL